MVLNKRHMSLFHHSVQVSAPFPSELLLSNAGYYVLGFKGNERLTLCYTNVQSLRLWTINTQLLKTKTQFALVNEMNSSYLDVNVDVGGVPDPVVVDVDDGGRGGGGENFECPVER